MIRSLSTAAAITLAICAGSAFAADLPFRASPPLNYTTPAPASSWAGFYVGLNLGGGWSGNAINPGSLTPFTDLAAPGSLFVLPGSTNGGSNAAGVLGGAQVGYNYQFGKSYVIGAEADFQGTSMSSGGNNAATTYVSPLGTGNLLLPLAPAGNIGLSLNWIGTVRGRAGYLVTPTLLFYGTGGFAYGGVAGNVSGFSNTATGWTAGGGVEWMFASHWTAKLEYLYMDLNNSGVNGAVTGYQLGSRNHPEINIVRAGVNYLFNFGAPAPVVARY
jgi:outer membrane immunogenic protein